MTRPRVHIEGAVKSFAGRVVVDIADLTLGAHAVEGLIGPNGAGKTTLMRMIMHSTPLDQGTIALLSGTGDERLVLSDMSTHLMARNGVVKSNQVIMDFEQLTILDSLLLAVASASDEGAADIYREDALYEERIEEIRWYLEQFPFEDPYGFARSAGEKKLLDILRCLLLKPKVLLLDEPAAGLPEHIAEQVMALVREKAVSEGMSVVIVEHDLHLIWNLSDYVHFMAEGSVILQGDPGTVREHEMVVEKYLGSGHV